MHAVVVRQMRGLIFLAKEAEIEIDAALEVRAWYIRREGLDSSQCRKGWINRA